MYLHIESTITEKPSSAHAHRMVPTHMRVGAHTRILELDIETIAGDCTVGVGDSGTRQTGLRCVTKGEPLANVAIASCRRLSQPATPSLVNKVHSCSSISKVPC